MMGGGRFQDGIALVKEGAVLVNGGEIGGNFFIKGCCDRIAYNAFCFVQNNLDTCCSNIRLLIVNG